MKVIFSIAKNEFRYLFYSPIAWFVLLVFLVQCGYFYADPLYSLANMQEIYVKNAASFKGFSDSLTKGLFLKSEFFPNIIQNLFLFIPILTMGLISREVNNGTNALLYSSPVSIRRIVLGKFVGIMCYNLLLVLVIVIFMITGIANIKHADYGALLSALLGFYLLVCAYAAIGLFMSSLSNYQVVSALATFMAIFALSHIGGLWQRSDLVRDLTWFLSLQDRTGNMLKGLIVTKDIIYFVLVSLMFIAFTYFRLAGLLEFKPWFIRTGRYLATIAIVLVVGYISSRPTLTGYLDTTRSQRNTLKPITQELLKEFKDSTLEVTLFTNILGQGWQKGLPENRNAEYLANFWEPYLRFKPDIKFNYVYYYANDPTKDDSTLFKRYPGKQLEDIAHDYCEMIDASMDMFSPMSAIEPVKGLLAESPQLVMQLKYKGHTAFLRTYNDTDFWPYEFHSIAALKRVLGTAMPAIAYSTGALERSISKSGEREYAFHSTNKENRFSLVNLGFDTDTINLDAQPISADITALVMADPKTDLNATVQNKISDYIGKGGNLMIYGEPGKQYVLNPVLSKLGMQLENGQLVFPTYDETPDKVVAFLTQKGGEMIEAVPNLNKERDTMAVLMPGTTAVTRIANSAWQNDSIATTLPNKSWLKKGSLVIDSILPPFDAMAGDFKQVSFPAMQAVTRMIDGKEQRILISGDADFISNLRYSANLKFILAAYGWMAYNQFPILTGKEINLDVQLNIGERAARYQRTIFIWIVPGIVLLAGILLLIRRKRK